VDKAELKAAGWHRLPGVTYTAALGPIWVRLPDGVPEVGLQAQEHLANDNLGIVHGGAIATFADVALGFGVGQATGMAQKFVTVQMQVQFTAAASVGDFIFCRPHVVRKTSSLVFVRGLLEVGERTVASADGIFRLLDPDKAAAMQAS
jgi:acyl-coenzyme A thioesterase PaaI-like protein